jgi:aryl-alcohol dehydrogenase-like predicted oxidoreductase
MNRRHFVKAALAVVAGSTVGQPGTAQAAAQEIPNRVLGRTGQKVSAIGVGGFHLSKPSEKEAIAIVHAAIDGGINFLDNSWDYAGGKSEERMGKALSDGYRERAFLMTKVDGRTAKSAMEQLEQSLTRLKTDRLDLLQFHEVIRLTDCERIFAAGGAIEAVVKARDEGKVRFIGFTGHKSPAIHQAMLDTAKQHGFRFDAVQLPLNVMDAHHDSFEKAILPTLVKDGIGVLGMKPMGDPYILQSKTVGAADCLRYAMSLPVCFTNTGLDSMKILQQAFAVGRGFQPLSLDERSRLLAKTEKASRDGKFEKYKTSEHFDSTAKHPEWLG